jgi:hypothetical protein
MLPCQDHDAPLSASARRKLCVAFVPRASQRASSRAPETTSAISHPHYVLLRPWRGEGRPTLCIRRLAAPIRPRWAESRAGFHVLGMLLDHHHIDVDHGLDGRVELDLGQIQALLGKPPGILARFAPTDSQWLGARDAFASRFPRPRFVTLCTRHRFGRGRGGSPPRAVRADPAVPIDDTELCHYAVGRSALGRSHPVRLGAGHRLGPQSWVADEHDPLSTRSSSADTALLPGPDLPTRLPSCARKGRGPGARVSSPSTHLSAQIPIPVPPTTAQRSHLMPGAGHRRPFSSTWRGGPGGRRRRGLR